MSKWRKAVELRDYTGDKYGNDTEWEDCTIGFYCICGNKELICVDSQSESDKCEECGREFSLRIEIMVNDNK